MKHGGLFLACACVIIAVATGSNGMQSVISRHHFSTSASQKDQDVVVLAKLGKIGLEVDPPARPNKITTNEAEIDDSIDIDRVAEGNMRTSAELELRIAGIPFDSRPPDDKKTYLHSPLHAFRYHESPAL